MTDLINSIDISLAFNDENIRIVGTTEEPMFVVKDICKILGLSNVTEVLRNIPDKWKYSVKLNTSTQGFRLNLIPLLVSFYMIVFSNNVFQLHDLSHYFVHQH